LNRIDN